MNTCWKCGTETPDGVIECSGCQNYNVTFSHQISVRRIDWNKVQTLDDMKRIMAVFGMQVVAGSPAEDALKEFLEEDT